MSKATESLFEVRPSMLIPLTPEYIETEHGVYVAELNAALSTEGIRNIALSGNYGVGKSSILKRIVELHEEDVVELSLSTLAPIESAKFDESVPKQASTPTNQIQHEIVKQLLYRAEPSRTPASRFRRIDRFRPGREVFMATLVGFVASVIFILAGWTDKLLAALPALAFLGATVHLEVAGVITLTVFLMRGLIHGRLSVKQVSAGSAAVTLDDKSVSYFDQYLDEILYFFEVSKRTIVIFEDIDRFNDSYIFETLRSLNTLLNASPQIKRPIRFIYAIKDSIFDEASLAKERRRTEDNEKCPAQAETLRANRTKFFDLVIPVVPFVTHRSAKNLVVRLLHGIDHRIQPDLVDLASRYVPDMRLMKNLRNEFVIFRDRIFSGDGAQLNLSESELFAMMLYKSTHMLDFEALRVGESNLDFIYQISRDVVATHIRKIDRQIAKIQHRMDVHDALSNRSAQLGDELVAYLNRASRMLSLAFNQAEVYFNGRILSVSEMHEAAFWQEFIAAPGDPKIELRRANNYHSPINAPINRSDLSASFGPFVVEDWGNNDVSLMTLELDKHLENRKFLQTADTSDLMARSEFILNEEDPDSSVDRTVRGVLSAGLAYHLVRAGYINRNFTLYTATFHGDRVGAAATNFIIHHVERDVMDEYFDLQADDVNAILRECGIESLRDSALYNIAILDHLLISPACELAAETMIRSLSRMHENEIRFLRAYLSGGKEREALIQRLAKLVPSILTFIVDEEAIDKTTRNALLSRALLSLDASVGYSCSAGFDTYITENSSSIEAFQSVDATSGQATTIARVMQSCRVRFVSMTTFSDVIVKALVARDLYIINDRNLQLAIGGSGGIALDDLMAKNDRVYAYALSAIASYVEAVAETSFTVNAPESFRKIVDSIADLEPLAVDQVIGRASPDCRLEDISGVSQNTWRSLAAHGRFPATGANVAQYVAWANGVDEQLARLLVSAGRIGSPEVLEESVRIALALSLLNARGMLSAELRAKLAADLDLKNYLNPNSLAPESGDLFALLVDRGVIHDSEAAYSRLASTDWPSRERYIQTSSSFAEYMSPEIVGTDLDALLRSEKIPKAVKNIVLVHASAYLVDGGRDGLREIARLAFDEGFSLPLEVVKQLPAGGVDPGVVLTLLAPKLADASGDDLSDILSALGHPYADLAHAGKDRPKVDFSSATVMVLDALKEHGIVNSYAVKGSLIRVNKKHS